MGGVDMCVIDIFMTSGAGKGAGVWLGRNIGAGRFVDAGRLGIRRSFVDTIYEQADAEQHSGYDED